MLLFGRSFSPTGVLLTTENLATARRTAQFTAETTGAIIDITTAELHKKHSTTAYTITAAGDQQAAMVIQSLGHSGNEISLRINLANLENDCCSSAFLRGAFLTCGTVTAPEREYHLEFSVPYMNLANDLIVLIRDNLDLNLEPRISRRKGSFVVYIKGGERISDFLTFLGAPDAAMNLIQVRMLKELRNNVNRQTNFETANIEKTASAAAQEVLAIEKIQSVCGVSALPEELRELAGLRLQFPEKTLRELGQHLAPPLSRSGVHHRLQRILEFAEKLR